MSYSGFRAFLYLCGLLQAFVSSTEWVDDVTRYIVKDSDSSELKLITRLDANETLGSSLIQELIVKLVQRMPTWRINLDEDLKADRTNRWTDQADDIAWPVDSPATFFLLVLESCDSSSILKAWSLIDAATEMAAFHYRSKYLVVSQARTRSEKLEELLRHTWTKKALDLTILELVQPEVAVDRSRGPTIHRYNPFKSEYARLAWSSGAADELFPDKVANMWGYPLRVGAVNMRPFTIIEYNERQEIRNVSGANILALRMIADKLNATIKFVQPNYEALNLRGEFSDPIRKMHSDIDSQRIDVQSSLTARFSTSRNESLRSASMIIDRFCAVVPILPETKMPVSTDFFEAYLLSIGIVVTFCLVGWLLRFDGKMWRPFAVGRVLFGVTVARKPRANVERILLACLLLTSAIYSSNIYVSITNVSLETEGEKEFRSFADLDESGLVPMLSPFAFDKTFENAHGPLLNLKRKSIALRKSMRNCSHIAVLYKNVTCCLFKMSAKIAIAKTKKNGRASLKIVKPCFWTDSRAFVLGKRSPYRHRIDVIIMQMHRSGIIRKLYTDGRSTSKLVRVDEYESLRDTKLTMMTLREQLLAIAVFGLSLASFAFITEILVHHVVKRKNLWLQLLCVKAPRPYIVRKKRRDDTRTSHHGTIQ